MTPESNHPPMKRQTSEGLAVGPSVEVAGSGTQSVLQSHCWAISGFSSRLGFHLQSGPLPGGCGSLSARQGEEFFHCPPLRFRKGLLLVLFPSHACL